MNLTRTHEHPGPASLEHQEHHDQIRRMVQALRLAREALRTDLPRTGPVDGMAFEVVDGLLEQFKDWFPREDMALGSRNVEGPQRREGE